MHAICPHAISNPEGVNVILIPKSDSCKIDMQLCRIVSDISLLLTSSSFPWPDTERFFASSMEEAKVRRRKWSKA